jgi:hypothetical protein
MTHASKRWVVFKLDQWLLISSMLHRGVYFVSLQTSSEGHRIAQWVKPLTTIQCRPWGSRSRVRDPIRPRALWLRITIVILQWLCSAAQLCKMAMRCVLVSMVVCRIKNPWDLSRRVGWNPDPRPSVLAPVSSDWFGWSRKTPITLTLKN